MRTTRFDIGDRVACDLCSCVYLKGDRRSGGYLFGSKGVGPCCADRFMHAIKRHDELHFVGARCAEGQSFHEFIMAHRSSNTVTITAFDSIEELLATQRDKGTSRG